MLTPESKPAQIAADGQLTCPNCGGRNLYHGEVSVFDRGEDDPTVAITRVNAGKFLSVAAHSYRSRNPSPRRHGIKVTFKCEVCDQDGSERYLNIAQHEGETFIYWGL